MIEGVILVSAVLWLFLRAFSGSFAVALTMPPALLTAFVGLHYAGVPANLLSMGAVDFGISAFSRPASRLARLGGPLTTSAQRLMTARYLRTLG